MTTVLGHRVRVLDVGPRQTDALFIVNGSSANLEVLAPLVDILSRTRTSIDIGPTRHGITRGETIYFFDPSGNRNEVFCGGYIHYPDKPTITWYDETLGPAIFYHDRKLNERFLSVVT